MGSIECYRCHETGHIARECPSNEGESNNRRGGRDGGGRDGGGRDGGGRGKYYFELNII